MSHNLDKEVLDGMGSGKPGSRAKDRAVKAKIEGAPARSTHNAYANYLQYKRMDKADPTGALKSRIKSEYRHKRSHA